MTKASPGFRYQRATNEPRGYFQHNDGTPQRCERGGRTSAERRLIHDARGTSRLSTGADWKEASVNPVEPSRTVATRTPQLCALAEPASHCEGCRGAIRILSHLEG